MPLTKNAVILSCGCQLEPMLIKRGQHCTNPDHKNNGAFTIYLVKEIRTDGVETIVKHYTKAGTAKGYATRQNKLHTAYSGPRFGGWGSKFVAYSMTGPLTQL